LATLTELDGQLHLDCADAEVELLRDLFVKVDGLLADDGDDDGDDDDGDNGGDGHTRRRAPADPVLARLLPDAHRDDPDIAAEHRELTEETLRQDKRADCAAVLGALAVGSRTVVIDHPDVWLRALNDVRLMMGVELDIDEDTEFPRRVLNQRDFQLTAYFWLTHLQDRLVEAVLH